MTNHKQFRITQPELSVQQVYKVFSFNFGNRTIELRQQYQQHQQQEIIQAINMTGTVAIMIFNLHKTKPRRYLTCH